MAYTTINKPTDYFNTVLHTGNNSSGRTFTGYGHQPDFIWTKARDSANYNHVFVDSVRGGDKMLFSNNTAAEDAGSHGIITSWNSDGVTWIDGTNATYPRLYYNDNGSLGGDDYVNWSWKAGGTASSNTDGSITSTVSANTTAGFSIVSYTGTGANATVGHGLGVAPSMMIVKQRNSTENWTVYHSSIGNPAQYMELNSTGAVLTNSAVWNSTNPTSSVFSVGTNARTNNNTSNYIAYCFAEKTGYSKFGSYTGNGNADGTFIYTGFKPSFVFVKRTDGVDNWFINDNKRNPFNEAENPLRPNLSTEEYSGTGYGIDILSNGFKVRTADQGFNASGGNYIFMAFGQSIVGSNNIPATAR